MIGREAWLWVVATAVVGCARHPPRSSPSEVTAAPPVGCPPRANAAPGPVGSTPLAVWRSRAELPACISALVPIEFDFAREMIAADLPPRVGRIELESPELPLERVDDRLVIEQREAGSGCPPCRGAVDRDAPSPARGPSTLWRLPRVEGVSVFHRVKPSAFSQPCPPCTAP